MLSYLKIGLIFINDNIMWVDSFRDWDIEGDLSSDPNQFIAKILKEFQRSFQNDRSQGKIVKISTYDPSSKRDNGSQGGGQDDNQGDNPQQRDLRYTQVRKGNRLILQVNLKVPESWISFQYFRNLRGFILKSTAKSAEHFRLRYEAPRDYIYQGYTYRRGVLQILFVNYSL